MIIWTLGAGAVFGGQILKGLGIPTGGPQSMAVMFGLGALISLALTLWAFPRLDKPRPAMLERPLAEPIVDERGRTTKTEIVQAVDADGNGLFVTPRSTLFFIPARFYWIIFAVVAIVATVQWVATS